MVLSFSTLLLLTLSSYPFYCGDIRAKTLNFLLKNTMCVLFTFTYKLAKLGR